MDEYQLHENETPFPERESLLRENEAELPAPITNNDSDAGGSAGHMQVDSGGARPIDNLPDQSAQPLVATSQVLPGVDPNNDSAPSSPRSDNQQQGDVSPQAASLKTPSTITREVKSEKVRHLPRSMIRDWYGEVIACLIFVGFLLATVFTLLPRDGKTLPNYPINTILSFYGVMLEGSLTIIIGATISQNQWRWFKKERDLYDIVLYDEAATEPLGAAKYLCLKRLREPLTAMGAILLISTLLIDPFVQQLVQYTDCSTNLTQVATIPRTSYYSPLMAHQGASDASPLPDQTSGWNSGMFSSPPDVNFKCSTGNCTFSTQYSTVGFCTKCIDISGNLTFQTNITDTSDNIISSLPGGLSVSLNPDSGSYQTYFAMAPGSSGFEIILARSSWPTSNVTSSDLVPDRCNDSSVSADSWSCRGYGAASCSIGHCVRTYRASVEAGRLTEILVDSTPPFDNWGVSFVDNLEMNTMIDTRCISPHEANMLRNAGYVVDPQVQWLAYNSTISQDYISTNSIPPDATFPLSMFAKSCVYMIPYIFVQGFYEYFLLLLLNGTVQGQFGPSGLVYGYSGPQVLQRLFNFGDTNFTWVDSIMSNGSTALTNHIRQNGVTNFSASAVGVVSHFATCVHVQWVWLSLPAISGGLALIILGLSIGVAWAQEVPMWKSSPLPLIFYTRRQNQPTVDGDDADAESVQDLLAVPATRTAMKAAAKGTAAKLQSLGPVIRLREKNKMMIQRNSSQFQ